MTTLLLALLALSGLSLLTFAVLDAYVAFDGDPNTHTISEYIKKWVKKSKAHKMILMFGIFQLGFVVVYLFAHWILQIV